MKYETSIGLRYLRAKRKEAFISFTTWISVAGIAIGVTALIWVIAVMTGFQDEIRERILGINPHILVLDRHGEVRNVSWVVDTVRNTPGVTHALSLCHVSGNGAEREAALRRGCERRERRRRQVHGQNS